MPGRKIAFYNSTDCFSGLEKNILRYIEWMEGDNEIVILSPQDSLMARAANEKKYPLILLGKKEKYFSLKKSYRLARQLKEQKIELLFIVRPRDILMTSLTKVLFHRKLLLVFFQQSILKLKRHPFLYKMLFDRFDAWIAPSENVREKMLKMTRYQPARCYVIAPCVDLEYYQQDTLTRHAARTLLELPEDRIIMGHIGRHDKQRKQDFLIRAIQLLRKNNFDIELLIMGHSENEEEKEYYEFLKELVKECAVERFIHFRPYSEKMTIFYRAIDIFVMNSSPEPYDLALVKAMASGIPVLAPYSDHHVELLGNGNFGLLYKAEHLEDFTAKIIHLLTQPKLVDYLKKKARRNVHKRYDKVKSCRHINNLINQLLEKQ